MGKLLVVVSQVVQVGDVKRLVDKDAGAVLIGYRTSKFSIHENHFPIRGEGAYVGTQLNGQSTHHGECTWRTEIDFASTLLDPLDELLVIRHLFVHIILSRSGYINTQNIFYFQAGVTRCHPRKSSRRFIAGAVVS
jgi:hypothetical protein